MINSLKRTLVQFVHLANQPAIRIALPHPSLYIYPPNADFDSLQRAIRQHTSSVAFVFPPEFNKSTKLHTFFNSPKAEVGIQAGGSNYVLKNIAAQSCFRHNQSQATGHLKTADQLRDITNLSDPVVLQAAQFIQAFKAQIKKLPPNTRISEAEANKLFAKASQNISGCQERLNSLKKVEQQLLSIQEQLLRLQNISSQKQVYTQTKFRRYLAVAMLVGVSHFAAFSYMIFGVQWLGWDIIQPLTYTLSQVGILVAMRFFLKYRKNRSLQSIKEVLSTTSLNRYQTTVMERLAKRQDYLRLVKDAIESKGIR